MATGRIHSVQFLQKSRHKSGCFAKPYATLAYLTTKPRAACFSWLFLIVLFSKLFLNEPQTCHNPGRMRTSLASSSRIIKASVSQFSFYISFFSLQSMIVIFSYCRSFALLWYAPSRWRNLQACFMSSILPAMLLGRQKNSEMVE